jgi:lysophospholipase L1-like esterase
MSFLISATFFYGFLSATNVIKNKGEKVANNVEKNNNKEDKKELKNTIILGLGDSLTKGIGDEKGEGYFQKTINKLKIDNPKIKGINFAVSGAKTNDLITTINQNGVVSAIKEANIIVITIGGNDLFPGWDRLSPDMVKNSTFNSKDFNNRMDTIFTSIHKINPNTKVYWLTLYNPFEEFEVLGNTNEYVQLWNFEAEKLSNKYKYVNVIPIFDLFKGKTVSMLYSDNFHPNSIGYEVISERVVQNLSVEINELNGVKNGK